MASKKRYEFQMFFNRTKNSAAQELQSPAPPLKRMVILLSFRKDGHIVISEELSYGGNNGGIAFLMGENMGGIYRLISRGHSERMVIVIPKMIGSDVNHIFNEDYFKPTV